MKVVRPVPKLRFKQKNGEEFPGYKTKRLEDLFLIKAGGDIDKAHFRPKRDEYFRFPVYANSKKLNGLHGYSDIYQVDKNCITVTGRGTLGIATPRFERFYPIVRLLLLFPLNRCNLTFFSHAINQLKIFNESTGVPQLTAPQLRTYQVTFPSLNEQQKIAGFLTANDERLESLEQKKKLLEEYKQGLMKKLFNRELRFKSENGEEFPEWEQVKLGTVTICLDHLRIPLNETQRSKMKGKYPYFGANGIVDYLNDYIFDEELILLAEDGGHFEQYATRPIAFLTRGKCWVNNHAHVLRCRQTLTSTVFLYFRLVHANVLRFVHGGTRVKLNKAEMLKIPLLLPKISEQKWIAEFLTAIDDKIEMVNNQIEKTQSFKQGLLQQLFV